MMRTPLMAGNWKMNKTVDEAVAMVNELKGLVADAKDVDVAICAPAVDLYAMNEVVADTNIDLGAQNMYYKESGAYTAELSPAMVKSVGCKYVIIGHSERREIFGETDELLNLKLKAAFANGIVPILCIGETLTERESGALYDKVKFQLAAALSGIEASDVKDMVLAYEPIWAIGTGKTATPEQAEEMIKFIRETVADMYDTDTAEAIRIQYGGSVKPNNVKEIMAQPNIDGALVGGASLEAESFSKIVNFK
jgi:triosephosphate isomerase